VQMLAFDPKTENIGAISRAAQLMHHLCEGRVKIQQDFGDKAMKLLAKAKRPRVEVQRARTAKIQECLHSVELQSTGRRSAILDE
jgi:hypothetical protein